MSTYQKNSLTDAISKVQSGDRVFIHGGAATPNALIDELVFQAPRLKNVTLIHLHTEGQAAYADEKYKDTFRVVNLFVGGNMRGRVDYDRVDYLPCFLSEIPALFRSGQCKIDVALLHVSAPDRFGYVSLGVSVDIAKAALESAKMVIAQVNPQMPRVHGDGMIHMSAFHTLVEVNEPIPECKSLPASAAELKIAKFVSDLIEDGSTLQLGIGSIPDAVARELGGHKNLGIHTEMWSDGALELIEKGAINNSLKRIYRGKSVSGFLMGSRRLYDFVNDNPSVLQLEIDYVNHPNTIAKNPRVAAINSAVEIDLTGQVCADSIGHSIISGVGGQMDFMRGAALSQGGKPIIALESVTGKGFSKIVSSLKPGAGVVTTRSHVHYVVSEFGVAHLYGRTISERARAMIAIAHPDHRETLDREFSLAHKK